MKSAKIIGDLRNALSIFIISGLGVIINSFISDISYD